MTRRSALLAVLSVALADVGILTGRAHANSRDRSGGLRVPLDTWEAITFEHKGQSVRFTTAEVFKALKGEDA